MKMHLALVAALAAACTGDVGTKDTGGTDTGTANCDNVYDGPVTIEVATVECTGDEVTFYAETKGLTDGGMVFTQETGNQEPNYSDEHDLASFEFDNCGRWDHLRRTIQDASTLDDAFNDWQRNSSTVFDCDLHYGDGDVVTYAFVVMDQDGNEADCIAYGEDVQELINNSADRVADPSFNTSQCVEGVNTM